MQERDPGVTLAGLDKGVYVGPTRLELYSQEDQDKLNRLGWAWSEAQESWEYYTGHG